MLQRLMDRGVRDDTQALSGRNTWPSRYIPPKWHLLSRRPDRLPGPPVQYLWQREGLTEGGAHQVVDPRESFFHASLGRVTPFTTLENIPKLFFRLHL